MRILISDYSGHPFPVELSRELVRLGHTVRHLHFAGFQTPKGKLLVQADDPPSLEIEGITLGQPFAKSSFVKRWRQERAVGRAIAVNFGSDEMVTISKLVDMTSEVAGKPVGKRYIPGPTGVRGRNSDNRLIAAELGWRPQQSLHDGLVKTYSWIEQQVEAQRQQDAA